MENYIGLKVDDRFPEGIKIAKVNKLERDVWKASEETLVEGPHEDLDARLRMDGGEVANQVVTKRSGSSRNQDSG